MNDIIKYKLGIEINPYIEKHIFIHDENNNEVLPKEFYTDVTYNNDIKALSIELGTYNLISYDRLSDFFNVITNNVINISNGTLVNFLHEFSNKSERTINNIENNILNGETTFSDETSAKFNKKNLNVRNYSNERNAVYKAHKNKGHKPILEDNILPGFCGGIMGEHDTTLNSYGTKRYECNIHVGRYLEELIQNKCVLVTGGGGSIGSELCRQIVKYNPKTLVIFDIYENNLYNIEMELRQNHYDDKINMIYFLIYL